MPARDRPTPRAILVRGARVHNLRDIDVDVPLQALTALTGLSGSGKSSLAMGVLYAEGSRRYLEALSTYTRRRLKQTPRPAIDRVDYCPAALALSQRPPVPGPRSTVGTMTQSLAIVRLMFSRIGTQVCPNGHSVPPSYRNAMSPERHCPTCQVAFEGPSAEDFSYNGPGACPVCKGLGVQRTIDPATLVPDTHQTIADGAVAPWRGLMRSNLPLVAADLGVRIDVPWQDLSDAERHTVLHGPSTTRKVTVPTQSQRAVTMNIQYLNAYDAVAQIAQEGTGAQAAKFFTECQCTACHGTRYNPHILQARLLGQNIAQFTAQEITTLAGQLPAIVAAMPADTQALAQTLVREAAAALAPLQTLGPGYLSLARAGDTLSTGERQRIQLARIATSHSTGLLMVLDEPTVGLHPDDVAGLVQLFQNLVDEGNTLVVVDHDVQVLRQADRLIEIGPGAGSQGGTVISQGSVADVEANPHSRIAPFLRAPRPLRVRATRPVQLQNALSIQVGPYLNIQQLEARFPLQALTVVTGASGAGKSALVIDTLAPALQAQLAQRALPPQVVALDAAGLTAVEVVDASPVGRNVRSTLATYAGIFDPIRRLFADTPEAQARGWGSSYFSYNTKEGQCPTCLGTGLLNLDLQYLPDLPMDCPSCHGQRYRPEISAVTWQQHSITALLALTASDALPLFADIRAVRATLQAVVDVGLGYVTLGQATPALSGGEAQRLRLAKPIHAAQKNTLYIFDEPTIGLHPQDVQTWMAVMDRLIDQGATIIAVDHDLDLIANADYLLELGPGSGAQGGQLVACGTVDEIQRQPHSRIAPWLTGAWPSKQTLLKK